MTERGEEGRAFPICCFSIKPLSAPLRRLILSSADEGASSSSLSCTELLWTYSVKGRCAEWFGSHADKVLAAMVRCGSSKVRAEACKELRPLLLALGKKDVDEWAEALIKPQAKASKAAGPAAQAGKRTNGQAVTLSVPSAAELQNPCESKAKTEQQPAKKKAKR